MTSRYYDDDAMVGPDPSDTPETGIEAEPTETKPEVTDSGRHHCDYEFVSGAKKGTTCGRWIRKHNATRCGVHARQDRVRSARATKAYLAAKKIDDALIRAEMAKPRPISDAPRLFDDQRASMRGGNRRDEVDAFNAGVRRDHHAANLGFNAMMAPRPRRMAEVDIPFWAMLN